MKEQFLDYEHSKMMKELGFTNPCLGEYDQVGGFRYYKNVIDEFTGNTIPAPLHQQAKEWLWEYHSLYVYANDMGGQYCWYIRNGRWRLLLWGKEKNDSPITAEKEGINKAIEYLHSQLK